MRYSSRCVHEPGITIWFRARRLNTGQTDARSLWAATAAPLAPQPQLIGPVRADVAIVGAGYTGLAAALHLSAAGRSVVVIDAVELGERASGLNGGQVIPGLKYDPDTLEEMYGPQLGPKLVATIASGADLVFQLIGRHQIACDAVRNGWLQLATSEATLGPLAARAGQWQQRGAAAQLLTRQDAVRLTGSQRYCGGWLDRRGGTLQPLSYVRGLARSALRAGCRIHAHSPALRLTRTGRAWCIETPRGELTSELVILATNAYADRLHEPLRRSVVAIPSFQVATAPIPPALRAAILLEGQAVSDTQRLLRYFRLDAGGRLIMGTRGVFGAQPLAVAARHHYRAVREIYPQLNGLPFEYHWGGLVAMTPDHLPHLHELAPGLRAALGYNGRGIAMATVLGTLLARWSLGEPPAELGFPVTPVRPMALHRCSRLGARVTIQALRALDGITRARDRLLGRSGQA
jgi:glycine/D-amino acid oxidase-like deaminating enzyme